MKTLKSPGRLGAWLLLILALGGFLLIACPWLSYCPPAAAVKFAFSGAWLKQEFHRMNAGTTLDQPTIGKFFLGASLLSYLAGILVWALRVVGHAGGRAARRMIGLGAAALVLIVLAEWLAPTFLLIQYVLSIGLTVRRFLGFCVCGGIWITLPAIGMWARKPGLTLKQWARSPLPWSLAFSLAVPTYYLASILAPCWWPYWTPWHTIPLLVWLALVSPIPCLFRLTARGAAQAGIPAAAPKDA